MYRRIKSIALELLFLLELHDQVTSAELREAFLTQATGSECQTLAIGDSWTSVSPIMCCLECMLRYPDTCHSCVYNAHSQVCRPGSVAFRPLASVTTSIPERNSNDKIFYAKQPVPPCDTSRYFALYEICGSTLCLNLTATEVNFIQAQTNCAQMNSRLFIANSLVRFSLYWHVSRDHLNYYTWLGLTDIDEEGKFVWDDGEPLSGEMNKYIWDYQQPNSLGNEDCTEARHTARWDPVGINDIECWHTKYYICEA